MVFQFSKKRERTSNAGPVKRIWNQIRCPEEGYRQSKTADIAGRSSLDDSQPRVETKECEICCSDKPAATEFPDRPVTDGCTHDPACKTCLRDTIRAAIDQGRWTTITCPQCPSELTRDDIAAFATPADFQRYDRLQTRRAMEQIPNFRWCQRAGCESGQIHDAAAAATTDPLMVCNACGFKMCYAHARPWHDGLTCAEFDDRNEKRLKAEADAVKAIMKRTTKPCPHCGKDIEKVLGTCNHMTCPMPVGCGYQFCYECLVRWTGYVGRTNHKPTCSSFLRSS